MRLCVDGAPHFAEGGVLHLFSGDREVAQLSLVPTIGGKAMGINSWGKKGSEIIGSIKEGGSVHLARHGDYLAYWVEGNHKMLERAGYFSGSRITAREYHGFVSDWADRTFDISQNSRIVASSCAGQDRCVEAGRTIGPSPRDIAFRSGNKWWGVCIPGALPIGETRIHVRPGTFSTDLCHYAAANTRGNLPKAYIATDLDDPYELLDADVELCRHRKELCGAKKYHGWWSDPIFCTWGEQSRAPGAADPEKTLLTARNVQRWAELIRRKTGVSQFTIIIDLPWFDKYGDFLASRSRFGGTRGMRKLIDDLHEAGHHVLLWFTPFKTDFDSEAATTQPDCLLLDREGRPVWTGAKSGCRDYTSAAARNTLINNLRYILSGDESCLNADGLKIDQTHLNPDPGTCRPANARWGIGDEHWAGLLRHIHEDAHRFKPDCLVAAGGATPYLDCHTDMLRLHRVLDGDLGKWFRRARLGLRLMPNTVIGVTGWTMTPGKYPAWWMTSPVFAVPTLYHAGVFDGGKKMTDADYRRLAAAWQVYANAPVQPDMEIVVEPETDTFFRRYTKGPMKGRYSAIGFQRRCFATFSADCARVTAARETEINLPVPKRPKKLAAVHHDGTRQKMKVAAGKAMNLTVPDAASDVKYLELTF